MAGRQPASTARARGSMTTPSSGTIRVRVCAGIDPASGRRHYLTELVLPGKKAQREAEAVRARLLTQVEERRNPRTNATVDELVRRHLDQFEAPNTLQMYRGHVKNHISPLLGRLNIGRLDPETLDSFYAELRRCRIHCSGSGPVDHRTRRDHEGDDRCWPHRCKPLSATTIRHIRFIVSGAYKRAVRWLGRAGVDGDDDGRVPRRAVRGPADEDRLRGGPRDALVAERDPQERRRLGRE